MSEDYLTLNKQVCFPIYALSREIIQKYRPLLDQLDLTYPQYLVLMVLWEKKVQTVNQLGEKLRLDSGTLTPLLKRLEHKNLVIRTRCTQDERVVEISLTPEGEFLKKRAEPIPLKMVDMLGINLEELIQLHLITNKILHHVQR